MQIKSTANIQIPSTIHESVELSIKNVEVSEVNFHLTPMENRCSRCNETFYPTEDNNTPEPRVVVGMLQSTGGSTHSLSPSEVFIVHLRCLEDFIPAFLNSKERTSFPAARPRYTPPPTSPQT